MRINTLRTVPFTKYPLPSLISKGSGVLPALSELHKPDTDSGIKNGIKTLLKANPSIDNKVIELFTQAADSEIKAGKEFLVGGIADGLSSLVQAKADDKVWNLLYQAADSAIKDGKGRFVGYIANGLSSLVQAKADDKVWNLFYEAADSAIKDGLERYVGVIADGLSSLVQAKADDKVWNLLYQAADSAIKDGLESCVGYIANGLSSLVQAKADDKVLNLFLQAADSTIKDGLERYVGLIAIELSSLVQAKADPQQIINVITTILDLSQSCHKANQIDMDQFFSTGLKSAVNLELISPKIHKALINDLIQRKNPLLYHETVKICNDLDEDDINELKTFLESKKRIFNDHQQFFLKVIAYYKLGKELGINLLAENPELKAIDNKKDLSQYFAKQVLNKLAESLEIDLDPNINQEEALKDWDLENLASLVATKDSWSEENTKLFKLLISSKLNNQIDNITNHTKKARRELTREMRTHDLSPNTWFDAHNAIAETSTLGTQAVRSASELSEEFKIKFTAFSGYLNGNQATLGDGFTAWKTITEHKAVEQLLKAQKPAEDIKDFAKSLQELANKQYTQGQVPEAVSDLLNLINNELVNYDPKAKKAKELKVAIWDPMDIGRNLFAGNRAGSCTALGQNASAIFKFILDPGTKYIYTKNSDGNITGYARVFLALDVEQKPKIFVDSVDGKAALKGDFQTMIPEVKAKLIELSQAIGLEEKDIINRKTTLASKLGGMPESYYHHAKFAKPKPNDGVSLLLMHLFGKPSQQDNV